MGTCDPGLRQTRRLVVEHQHTAPALGSGDVPVLGTPALLALAEGACVDAIAGDLPEGQTTVGVWAEVDHEHPSRPGDMIEAEATLIGHHGRRLEFTVTVRSGDAVVARVRHRRVLVDRDWFIDRIGGEPPAARPRPGG